ncbi:hypothetical protein AB1K42_24800, partial [Roseibium algicola]|uniref:hypothetical protein n=1 Tax=Roseibium algicola TaxID=2857014 RepID=UPI003459D4EA
MISVKGIDEEGVAALPLLKNFITMFISDFDVFFLDSPKKNVSLFATCVLIPRKEIEIMFGLDQPIFSIFFMESYVKFPIADIIQKEYEKFLKKFGNLDPRYVFVCSSEENSRTSCDYLSM